MRRMLLAGSRPVNDQVPQTLPVLQLELGALPIE